MNNIIVESKLAEEEIGFDVYSRLVASRIIFINDVVYDENATDIVATLIHLDSISQDKITLFINSEGGDLRNVMMIYDTMGQLGSPIETFCIGSAMHESALLLAAGTKGMRLISKNSDVNISQITHMGISYSDLTNIKIGHDKIQRDNTIFLKALAKRTKKTYAKIVKDTERQKFLTPEQAIAYGIADKIV